MNFKIHPPICYVRLAKIYDFASFKTFLILHHTTHAWGSTHRHSRLLLGLVADETLGGEEHAGDRSGVLQSHTGHLGRVDDSSLAQILVDIGTGIVTKVALTLADFLDNYCTLATGVGCRLYHHQLRHLPRWQHG